MELNKENIKKIMGMIAFAIILYFVLQNISVIGNVIANILKILSPFLIGAGLAFVLNLPMKFFERKLLKPRRMKNGKMKQSKMKRILSILLSFLLIVVIIGFIIQLIIPQLISVSSRKMK